MNNTILSISRRLAGVRAQSLTPQGIRIYKIFVTAMAHFIFRTEEDVLLVHGTGVGISKKNYFSFLSFSYLCSKIQFELFTFFISCKH